MRLIDEQGNDILEKDCDFTKGEIIETDYVNPAAYDTIDNVTKFALDDEDYEHVRMYRAYNDMDYAAMEAAEKQEKQQAFLDTAPQRVDNLETGVDDSYEAIADLGVDVADHAVALDDIMEAIAELGVTIEELNNG